MSEAATAICSPVETGSVPAQATVPLASLSDTLTMAADVLLPTLAKGVIIRRPVIMAVADMLDLDRRAIRRMKGIRDKYKSGPVVFRLPGRSVAFMIDPADVHRVLAESPVPFATASKEKRAALAHFEPENALISEGTERAERRRYNEEVLDTKRPVHRLASHFVEVVDSEADRLCEKAGPDGQFGWSQFSDAWFRVVRRVVFGDAAREDHELSHLMARLRFDANWAFLKPQRSGVRERLLEKIRSYIDCAEPDSLAGVMAATGTAGQTSPEHQVPQWLFAFDPAGMTTFRTLALLCSHPEYARKVREEIETRSGIGEQTVPCSRAAVLESLRLWPTTPLILRETRAATTWTSGVVPANTAVVIFTPFFHRDAQFPWADRFSPELWMDEPPPQAWPLIPFSEGPVTCPGRHLVLLLSTAIIAAILRRARIRLKRPHRLACNRPLPATLNHYGLRFELRLSS